MNSSTYLTYAAALCGALSLFLDTFELKIINSTRKRLMILLGALTGSILLFVAAILAFQTENSTAVLFLIANVFIFVGGLGKCIFALHVLRTRSSVYPASKKDVTDVSVNTENLTSVDPTTAANLKVKTAAFLDVAIVIGVLLILLSKYLDM